MDESLQRTTDSLGAGDSFNTIPLGIFLGTSGETVPYPYLEWNGPTRTGCIKCGDCLTGCPYNAKNSLDQNYLYMAEHLGVEILPERKVTTLRPLPGGGYEVEMENLLERGRKYPSLHSKIVV